MLFNSYYFIFLFLPLVFGGYYLFLHFKYPSLAKFYLVLCSLYFYSFFKLSYLPIILFSIVINYILAVGLQKNYKVYTRYFLLTLGVLLNVGILFYFKYTDFVFQNLNTLFSFQFPLLNVLLPLGISFYTFQQLSYLIDAFRTRNLHYNFLDYSLFVTFFPQLIAGPIVLPQEMLPQFAYTSKLNENPKTKINFQNINIGLLLFGIGLAKKCFIADSLGTIANVGFDTPTHLTCMEAWVTSLAFTLQLYFDFSGYCDMALGIAKFFNIDLPLNFNAPYKATNFQDFWRRWHITLGRFMMNYLYIPLGGNRKGETRTILNLFCVFVVSGLWHGAGWLFLLWGTFHGLGILIHRFWKQRTSPLLLRIKIHPFLAIFMTFFCVNILWIFFRAKTLERASDIIQSMFMVQSPIHWTGLFKYSVETYGGFNFNLYIIMLFIALGSVFIFPNANEISRKLTNFPLLMSLFTAICFVLGFICIGRDIPFLYFNF